MNAKTFRRAVKAAVRRTTPRALAGRPRAAMTVAEYFSAYRPTYSPQLTPIHDRELVIEPAAAGSDGTADTWRFQAYARRATAPTFVAQIDGGRVFGKRGAVVTKEGILLNDVSREFGAAPHSLLERAWLPRPRKIASSVAVLATDGAATYYHWMFDILPRVCLLKEADLLDRIEHFILPQTASSFHHDTLSVLPALKGRILVATSDDFAVEAEHLFVPSLPSKLGVVDKWACDYLSATFAHFMVADPSYPKKIYVTRKDAIGRRIRNETTFASRLEASGYREIDASQLPLHEQIKIFYNATHIIGPHGGGFTNIVFCRPGTRVMELFPASFVIPCYWVISNRQSLQYFCYADGPVEAPMGPYWTNRDRDIIVEDRFWPMFGKFDT